MAAFGGPATAAAGEPAAAEGGVLRIKEKRWEAVGVERGVPGVRTPFSTSSPWTS